MLDDNQMFTLMRYLDAFLLHFSDDNVPWGMMRMQVPVSRPIDRHFNLSGYYAFTDFALENLFRLFCRFARAFGFFSL